MERRLNPFVPSPLDVVVKALGEVGLERESVLVDLGSGDGRVPISANRVFGARAVGVELNPELVSYSRRIRDSMDLKGVEFVCADARSVDLRGADLVFAYLTSEALEVLKKAGVNVSQKAHLKKLEQRRQKEEQKDGEEKDIQEKTFIYDGKFANALNQLTIKVRRLNPYNKKHKQIIPVATVLLTKEIWMMLEEERKSEDGRVGEALDWVTGSPEKGGIHVLIPL